MTADALVIVDVQNDFCEGGALAVPGADSDFVRKLATFGDSFSLVYATRDWHPADHSSFDVNGGPWPVHCVAGTSGADLHPGLQGIAHLGVTKGTDRDSDGYSAATGEVLGTGMTLVASLRAHGVTTVHVVGLALDYCVKATATDLAAAGFSVVVHLDGTRCIGDQHETVRALIKSRVAVTPAGVESLAPASNDDWDKRMAWQREAEGHEL